MKLKFFKGDNDRQTLECMHLMGLLYEKTSRPELAEPYLVDSYDRRRATFGERDEETLVSMNSLGSLYYNSKKYLLAESLYKEVRAFCCCRERWDLSRDVLRVRRSFRRC